MVVFITGNLLLPNNLTLSKKHLGEVLFIRLRAANLGSIAKEMFSLSNRNES